MTTSCPPCLLGPVPGRVSNCDMMTAIVTVFGGTWAVELSLEQQNSFERRVPLWCLLQSL